MDQSVNRGRDLTYFLLGPGMIAAAAVAVYHWRPWPVPMPAQAQFFQPLPVAVILGLGALATLLPLKGALPSAPAITDGRRWRDILIWSVGPGVAFGAALFGLDALSGMTAGAAKALGVTWINPPLPFSLAHFGAAAVLLECLYRLIPIPLMMWLVSGVMLRGRGQAQVFWVLAVLTSLIEPASQEGAAIGAMDALLLALMVVTFAANLFEAAHLKRHGWPAPILFRLAFYAVWHCFGPYLLSPQSILYPGPH